MKETFLKLINYLKNPILEKDNNKDLNYRFKVFFHILFISVLTGILITPIFSLFEEMNWISMENHKVEELFAGMNKLLIILTAGVIIPTIEEAIFRGPLTAFKTAKSFKIGFYVLTLLFGFVHITNFDMTPAVLILAPLLVIPQLFAGLALGFLRVRFGLQWSILLHGSYNCFFILLSFIPEF
ncbi:CPBP family intramembrane glutamic endopeptidase [Polaribacter vadi]|uniref:CPBP family intramembrane glutamic endopeptidase n=1 Tax=Polaribacter vadi TaxID=1774273 RepID=UPI0030EDB33A|tara:strand:+ start:4925 stop:5473 length:549 start_codon:yes stop_codon:yes gene_type:complete